MSLDDRVPSSPSPGKQSPQGAKKCKEALENWSKFVDTFVGFAVSGYVLPPQDNPPETSPTFLPSVPRLIAVGDVHGDISQLRRALHLAKLIDESDNWVGGASVLVQVGDILDRGDDEIQILYLLEKLKRESARAGGAVHTILGNHETINIDGDFRFVTRGAFESFNKWLQWNRIGNFLKASCPHLSPAPEDPLRYVPPEIRRWERARFAALSPGGPIATRFFSQSPAVLGIGKSLFVHGGLLPPHATYGLERINSESKAWIQGLKTRVYNPFQEPTPWFFRGRDALVWVRKYSERSEVDCDCTTLSETLKLLPGFERMVMGHTIQRRDVGVNSVCEGKAVRSDVGMSHNCGGRDPQVVEILNDSEVRVLAPGKEPREI